MRLAALVLAAVLPVSAAPAAAQNVPAPAANTGPDITVFEDTYTLQFDEQNGEKLEDFINLAQKLLNRPIRYEPTEVSTTVIRIIGPQVVDQDRKSVV